MSKNLAISQDIQTRISTNVYAMAWTGLIVWMGFARTFGH